MELNKNQQSKYKEILIRTLKAFDVFCTDNNLRYFAMGGTAIGAVRHKGIIPWDDDIDVAMIREDYDRFLSLKHKLEGTQYKIIDPSVKGYYLPFAKFVDTNTTIWEVPDYEFVMGVFIDIFPLNHVDNNLSEITKRQTEYLKICRNFFGAYLSMFRDAKSIRHPRIIKDWIKYVLFNKYHAKAFWKFENQLKVGKGDCLLNYYTQYKMEKELFKQEWFRGQIRVPFENIEINLMSGYKEYLTQMFGDYMTPPPLEQQVSHHFHYFVDLERGLSIKEVKKIIKSK